MIQDLFLGIDPGLGGAFAIVDNSGGVRYASPFSLTAENNKKVLDCKKLYLDITQFTSRIHSCAIEQVHAMPRQGVVSTFSFGRGFGSLVCLLDVLYIPFEQVTAQKWKKHLFGFTTSDKKKSIEYAKSLEGGSKYLIPPGKKVEHDGVADAICLAEYSRLTNLKSKKHVK